MSNSVRTGNSSEHRRTSQKNQLMESGFIKIIECFDITGIGLMTEVQHFENGIPPDTTVMNLNTEESWTIRKRVLFGHLLSADSEIIFECETELEHLSHTFITIKDRELAAAKEREKRENGIYWYLLAPLNKKQRVKPENGEILRIAQ